MPNGSEWGLVAVTEDLMDYARTLGLLAHSYRAERRAWTHPAGRGKLADQATQLTDWAQEAALSSCTGDYWTRHAAVQLAAHRVHVARDVLVEWQALGELWNGHRTRPAPDLRVVS